MNPPKELIFMVRLFLVDAVVTRWKPNNRSFLCKQAVINLLNLRLPQESDQIEVFKVQRVYQISFRLFVVNGAVKNQSKIDIDRVFVVLYSTPPTLTEVILFHHRREIFAGPVALLNNYLELAEKIVQVAFSVFSPTILKLLRKLISLK